MWKKFQKKMKKTLIKVIDVDTTEKLVTSACCDRQHRPIHAYLQPFSRKTGQQRQNNDFYGGTALWCPRTQVSLNLEHRDLNRRNLRSMLKISYAAFPCLSQLIWHNSLLKCDSQPKIAKKSIKTSYFGVQGHPRSLSSLAIESQCTTSY